LQTPLLTEQDSVAEHHRVNTSETIKATHANISRPPHMLHSFEA
jgi:hypothetical protein